ncbi:hypothetical protein AAFN46_04290 [Pseudomonas sp. CAU 1711]|uniref:lipopolysaccharide biosynthesis protein n=1 Tax=Pseudomonas sp. CAU 1711 TaxID=3140356 RepID=UPI003260CEDD
MIPHRLLNVALRGLTLGSKFLLIFFLARFLEPAELGLYGLLSVTVGYALYLLGLDFYTFTTREILKRERCEWGALLKSQAALTLLLYALSVPLLLLLFVTQTLPWHLAFWFFALLVLEHMNQELMRLLIAISDQLMASVVLFLRSGAWGVVVVALMFVWPELQTLQAILCAWTLGGLLAVLLAFWRLARLEISGWQSEVDWRWIGRGIRIAAPLLIATLALRGLYTLDRYWLEALAGLEVLGAYVLFMGIANAMVSFLDAGVFAFSYPKLITLFQRADPQGFRREMKRLAVQTVGVSGCFAVASLLLIGPLLLWLDKPLYVEQQAMFPWILLGTLLFALGMIPHYGLYAQGQDRPIVQNHLAGLVVFVLSTWLFSLSWPQIAIPFGLCLAFLTMALGKSYAFFRLTPAQYYSH